MRWILYLDLYGKISDIYLDLFLRIMLLIPFFRVGRITMIFGRKRKKAKDPEAIAKAWFIRKTILAAIILVFCIFGIRTFYRFMTGWEPGKHKNFESLEMGSPVSVAEEMMGAPNRVSEYELESLPVTDYDEIKNESVRSGATTFYYYENGMSALYVLGFDAKGKMVFKKHIKA
jgi:hypothetical protein